LISFLKQKGFVAEMEGVIRAFSGATLNMLMGRCIRYNFHSTEDIYHFVFAHPDDELAIYRLLEISNSLITLVTNGTQGYEANPIQTRPEYGRNRVKEFNKSIDTIGKNHVKPLLDERLLYELLVDENYEGLKEQLDVLEKNISDSNCKIIFVNDFAGGHIIHDLVNFTAYLAAKKTNKKIIEYWQPFLHNGNIIVGDLGYDDQGRYLRDNTKGKYDVNIPELGIKRGRMFLSPVDIAKAFYYKKKIYVSQKKSLERLIDKQKASYGIDTPRLRRINLDTIDYTKKPSHGVLYEKAEWRQRELKRNPSFEDFKKYVEFTNHLLSLK